MTRVSRPVSDYETGFLQKKICISSACLEFIANIQDRGVFDLFYGEIKTELGLLHSVVDLTSCFIQYWNRQSQTSDDFDILIVVSKAKFQKKLNGQTRFCQDGPNQKYRRLR